MKPHSNITTDQSLTSNDRRLYLYLCKHAGRGGWIGILQSHLAHVLNLSRPTVSISYGRLSAGGYVIKERNIKTGRLWYRVVSSRKKIIA